MPLIVIARHIEPRPHAMTLVRVNTNVPSNTIYPLVSFILIFEIFESYAEFSLVSMQVQIFELTKNNPCFILFYEYIEFPFADTGRERLIRTRLIRSST